MDIGRAFGYVFQDPAWVKKVLIGGVLIFGGFILLPVLLVGLVLFFIVGGYTVRTIQRVYQGNDVPLPEWDDFGGDLVRGLKVGVTMFLWFLPVSLLAGCAWMLSLGGGSDNTGFSLASSGAALGLNCVEFFVSLIIWYFIPVVVSRVAVTENIAAGFQFNEILTEGRTFVSPLLITLLMGIVFNFVAGIGLVLCLVGVVFTSFLAYVMNAHMYGQFRRLADAGRVATASFGTPPGTPPLPPAPPYTPTGGGPTL